jgi:hypothetical protein
MELTNFQKFNVNEQFGSINLIIRTYQNSLNQDFQN